MPMKSCACSRTCRGWRSATTDAQCKTSAARRLPSLGPSEKTDEDNDCLIFIAFGSTDRHRTKAPWRRSRWITCPGIPAWGWKLRSVRMCIGSPASAADVGRNAADLVFLRPIVLAVPQGSQRCVARRPGGEAASPERTERRVGPRGSYRRSDVTVRHLGCIERIPERFERGSDGEEHDRQRGGSLCTISQIDTRDRIRRMIQGDAIDHFEGKKQKCGRDVERLPERKTRRAYCGSALLIAPIKRCAKNGLRRYAMHPLAKASS